MAIGLSTLIGRKTERTINYNNINIYSKKKRFSTVNLPNGWLDYDQHNPTTIRQQIETQLLSELTTVIIMLDYLIRKR
jgi:hypothetical protein